MAVDWQSCSTSSLSEEWALSEQIWSSSILACPTSCDHVDKLFRGQGKTELDHDIAPACLMRRPLHFCTNELLRKACSSATCLDAT